jgi:hypothetical protein
MAKLVKTMGVACLSVLVLVGRQTQAAEDQDGSPVSGDISAHFIFSPGLKSFLDDLYDDYDLTGGGGWFGLQGGVPIRVGHYVEIKPSLSGVFNAISVMGGRQDEDYLNFMVIPAVAAKVLTPGQTIRFFVGCEGNYNIPSTTSDEVDFSSDGFGGALFLGLEIQRNGHIELGYEYLPVMTDIGDYDFGGVMLRGGYTF